jgi:hypothetical protein
MCTNSPDNTMHAVARSFTKRGACTLRMAVPDSQSLKGRRERQQRVHLVPEEGG